MSKGLQHLSYEERLRDLGLYPREKEAWETSLISI